MLQDVSWKKMEIICVAGLNILWDFCPEKISV